MVRITDDYLINVDSMNYTLMRDMHKVDKSGSPILKQIGYYGSFTGALEAFIELSDAELLSKADMSLTEAVNRLKENHERIAGIIAMASPNVEVRERK